MFLVSKFGHQIRICACPKLW